MIRPCVRRLAALSDAERARIVVAALDRAHRRVHGFPAPGMGPYAPDPRHRIEPRQRSRGAVA